MCKMTDSDGFYDGKCRFFLEMHFLFENFPEIWYLNVRSDWKRYRFVRPDSDTIQNTIPINKKKGLADKWSP